MRRPTRASSRSIPSGCVVALLLALPLLSACVIGCATKVATAGDHNFAVAYEEHRSGLQVSGSGTVVRVLADDEEGSRHQRFIVALSSGQTLLITHNIDVAPRVAGVEEGDTVEFSGVYEWNSEGGLVHWTHHDPEGLHQPGWIKHQGVVYE